MKINLIILTIIVLYSSSLTAQSLLKDGYKAEVELQATGTTGNVVPFWMRSNQFGSVPLPGTSGSILGRFSKDYTSSSYSDSINGNKKFFDWGFGAEVRGNAGKNSRVDIIEGYIKGRASIFQLRIGRTKDVVGLNGDTTLSSGNFAVSGNALGIPKVELSIPEYFRVPVFEGIFSFKGGISHGWLGNVNTAEKLSPFVTSQNTNPWTYFHQKSFYARIGKSEWKLQLYGGFNHQVFWGSESEIYGQENWGLSDIKTFFYVATGKPYGGRKSGIERSKIGNQLGSIDLGISYKFDNLLISVYRQNFYDVGALAKLANISDGLNGITLQNLDSQSSNSGFHWEKILFEVFYTKNQAGYPWSPITASGDENYYNNYYYKNGWTYKSQGLGNPLITAEKDAKLGQATRDGNYYINNRVVAFHTGLKGSYNLINFLLKATYSTNYGVFGTSEYGTSIGKIRYPQTGNIFIPVNQYSMILQTSKLLNNDYTVGSSVSFDKGKLLNNSFGFQIRIAKQFK